jgi:hypothetical protein
MVDLGATIPTWVPLFGGWPINSPLVGSFFGVFLGFLVNYAWKGVNDKLRRLNYIKLFRYEFNQANVTLEKDNEDELFINPLKERQPSKLQIDSWTSAINNGDLRLFRSHEVDCLSRIYSQIKNYNDELQLYKNKSIEYSWPVGADIDEKSLYYLNRKNLDELNPEIIGSINYLLGKKWMLSQHWWHYWRRD